MNNDNRQNSTNNINWDIQIYGNTSENPYKIRKINM